jgi:hypothetical protein
MSWNLKSHILDHAHSVVNNLSSSFNENNPKNQHFTLSIDISQLIINKNCASQKDIDNIMTNFMNDLVQHQHVFEESKGRSKTGKQLRRRIVFNFTNALVAYHNSGSDSTNTSNYTVEPHLHILFDKKKKLGIGYYQLKEAINKISKKHGLVFNFQEEVEKHNNSLQKSATNFTWFIKKSNNTTFRQKNNNSTKLVSEIDKFIQHYRNSKNLQYYIKGMKDFQARLRLLNLDFIYKGHNIKDTFPLFLSSSQKETMKILHQGNEDEIYMVLNDRSNKIGRAFFEHQFGFKNIIMEELMDRSFCPLKFKIDDNKITLNIDYKKTKDKNNYEKTLSFCYKSDLTQALQVARDEKELQLLMQQLGYSNFAYKQTTIAKKRSKVGFSFTNKHNKKVIVYYASMKLSASDIRAKLVENNKHDSQVHNNKPHSFLNAYIPLNTKSKTNLEFEEIYHFDTSFDLTNWYIKELNNHVELHSNTTKIIDRKNTISVHKYHNNDLKNNAKLLVDMAIAKGWDVDNLIVTGTEQFRLSISDELLLRKNKNDGTKTFLNNVETTLENKSVRSSLDLSLQ